MVFELQVRNILCGDDADDDAQLPQPDGFVEHSLFVQLDVLCHFDEDDSIGWKEMARCETDTLFFLLFSLPSVNILSYSYY